VPKVQISEALLDRLRAKFPDERIEDVACRVILERLARSSS